MNINVLNQINSYISEHKASDDGELITGNTIREKYLKKVIKKYAIDFDETNETPLLLLHNTLMGSIITSILLSDKNIYYCSEKTIGWEKGVVSIVSITALKISDGSRDIKGSLYINGNEVCKIVAEKEDAKYLNAIFNIIVNANETSQNKPQEESKPVSSTNKCKKCGGDIDPEKKVCKYCKKPENPNLEVCDDCGYAKSKTAKMCPNCGKKAPGCFTKVMQFIGGVIFIIILIWALSGIFKCQG
jgi:hypothetical protein